MAGIFRTRFDFVGTERLIVGTIADLGRTREPIRQAHEFLAGTLQKRQANALERAVRGHGRAQRHENFQDGPMYQAIMSKNNREVTANGFTVGFLDDPSRFPDVALYARGLESGTGVHRGTRMRGYWVTVEGGFVAPVAGGKDVRIAGTRTAATVTPGGRRKPGAGSGFLIRNPIIGYRFQKAGFDQWKADGYNNRAAIEAYLDFMDAAGLTYAVRLFRPGRTRVSRS